MARPKKNPTQKMREGGFSDAALPFAPSVTKGEKKMPDMFIAEASAGTALKARATNEPLLPLWRAVRAAWAADAASEEDNDQTVKAYRAAFAAFDKAEPTTTLGLFLVLLHSDAGDDFADEHPAAVEAIIDQLQGANVSLRSLSAPATPAAKLEGGAA